MPTSPVFTRGIILARIKLILIHLLEGLYLLLFPTNESGMAAAEPARSPPHQLRNRCLETLHEMFPEADLGDLRYRINSKFQEHLELSEQLKMLLEQSQMGRKLKRGASGNEIIQPWAKFRSKDYIKAVEYNLRKEFKNLSRSTILAVMAENNHHYMKSRIILIDINRKSWRHKIASWIPFRSQPEEPKTIPKTVTTGCKELDDELWELSRAERAEQASSDLLLALDINEKQYEEAGAMLECECCFGDYAFEMMSACCYAHLFCHNCVLNAAKEGVYGQTTSLVKEKGSIRCLSSVADPQCGGYIPLEIVAQALPQEIFRAMGDKLIEDDIAHCGLPMAKCPFCMYAEADEIPEWTIRKGMAYSTLILLVFLASSSILIVMVPVLAGLLALSYIYLFEAISAHETVYIDAMVSKLTKQAAKKQYEKRREQMFQCRNSSDVCGKRSCRDCGKEWKAFHKCFENEEEALRLCVENAMAVAIKRTHTDSGGGGGEMNSVQPAAHLKGVGYKHFCQHFRQVPGTACTQCDKCDLYVQENESLVLKVAGEQAQAEWLAKHSGIPGWKPPQRQIIAGYKLSMNSGNIVSIEDAMRSIKTALEEAFVQLLERYVEFVSA
ncbi:hypothetical protein DRE_03322 [Drechslerella stenobrocha 248]|uniref:E3 ubiquitin-protein ligase RNF216 RING finger HC subclass domain-containing protein n=1 Tax=Drechslerella stenobrocha 248 TaxID=1043628 RepID=W7I4V9_9PEZI|nr:hypothetical protein DRE_03322 [Drechslerella stenobrocha 248]